MNSEKLCVDCNKPEASRVYGLGDRRCDSCAEIFNEKNRAERLAKMNAKHQCENCNETFIGEYDCPHCCEHDFDADEGFHCLNCGTDGTEEVMSRVYDMAKDLRKYGP